MKSKCQLHEKLFFPETEAAWRAQSSGVMNSLLRDDLQKGSNEIHVLKLSYLSWQHSGVGIFRKDTSVRPEILAHTVHPHLLVLDFTDSTCVKNPVSCASPRCHRATQHNTAQNCLHHYYQLIKISPVLYVQYFISWTLNFNVLTSWN